ncbi:O-antigen translocase [Planomicrobium okeanokoites]|uniref:O-antigen translocase n=1 Tax=Planomicrobium okeanokoites TaxID=244 RepID=UPI0030F81923
MNFFSTSIFSGISTIIKLLSGLVINKIVAVFIGPSGIAMVGQFQNFLSMATTLGNGGISSGVTKYVAEYNEEKLLERNETISVAIVITVIISSIIGISIFFASNIFSLWILNSEKYSFIFKIYGLCLIVISINSLLLSIINGLKKIKIFISINIISNLVMLLLTTILTITFKIYGAFIALVISQALIIFITVPLMKRKVKINYSFKLVLKSKKYRKLFAFSIMTLVATFAGAGTQILIRNYITSEYSLEEAGYWQSVWMLSNIYLTVLTTAFSTYYLPKLSELKSNDDLKIEILSGYKIIIPFVFISSTIIFLFRDLIIVLVFAEEFLVIRTLILYQFIGNFFKMISWSISFLMLAKAMTKTFIFTEIIFSISFYVFVILFTRVYGLEGTTIAYAVNYFLYFLVMIFLFRKIFIPINTNK